MSHFKNFKKGFVFTWKIENFSLLPHQINEDLESSTFVVESLNNTKWAIYLYPKGTERDNCISLFLHRADTDTNRTVSRISTTFAIQSVDGYIKNFETLEQLENLNFDYDTPSWGFDLLELDFLSANKNKYLPHDVLTIKCYIWPSQEKRKASALAMESATLHNYFEKRCSAITRIKVDKSTLSWHITKVSELCENQEKICIDLDYCSEYSPALKLLFYVNKDSNDKFAQIEILLARSSGTEQSRFVKCQMTVVTANKKHQTSHEDSHLFSPDLNEVWHFPEFILIDRIIDGKYAYLNDTMVLHCEFAFPQKHCEHHLKLPFCAPNAYQGSTQLRSNIGDFFGSNKFCDVEVQCAEKTFPCHKLALCAQSPVFTAMLENNMEEKKTGVVKIADFDPLTVEKMLKFLYKAVIEDELSAEEISNLYSIADKYEVLELQRLCSHLMLSNLSVANVCNVLATADRHRHDNFLWVHVNKFVKTHSKEIFHSPQWKSFLTDYITLGTEIMFKICMD